MALLSPTSPTPAGVFIAQPAVSASDTVLGSEIGPDGVLLWVENASGGAITVTLSDPTTTPSGNPGATVAQSVPNATVRFLRLTPRHVDPATGLVTITYSGTTSVTCRLIKC